MSAVRPMRERPTVVRTDTAKITVELTADQAHQLAGILTHYDAIAGSAPGADQVAGYRPEVWHHLLIDLFTETAPLRQPTATLVDVREDATDGFTTHLFLVAGDGSGRGTRFRARAIGSRS